MTTKGTVNRMAGRCGLILGWLIASAASASPEHVQFSHQRKLVTPSVQEEIAAVALDEDSWALLEAGAPNLCVFDAANTPTPYLLRRATARRVRRVQVPCPARVAALREVPDNRIEIDLELEKKAPAADTIRFETPLRDFERRVSVDGVDADGRNVSLVKNALIYDYSRFMDVRHVTIDLPRNDYRVLRVTIDAVTDTAQSPRTEITRTLRDRQEAQRTETATVTTRPFRITTVRLHAHRDEARNREPVHTDYMLKQWSVTEDTRLRTSTIEVETFHTPLTSLTIETPARNFSRRATVLVPYRRDGREQWRSIGSAALSRITFRDFCREALTVRFPEQQQRRVRLVLDNGDAAPLTITGVHGKGPLWRVLFLAMPGTSYRLLLGGGNVKAPEFDTSHIEHLLARDVAPRPFDVRPVMENPDYDAASTRQAWAWLSSRGLFVCGIVVVVAVLGVGLIRAGKTALANTSDDTDATPGGQPSE